MKEVAILIALLLIVMPIANAVDFDREISSSDREMFDQILSPVIKVYNLVKYVASAIAVLIMLFAGIVYMMSGADPRKRDEAKNMATYVIVGLIVIWAAPFVVNFIVGT